MLNAKYLLLLSFQLGPSFNVWRTFKALYGCINSKEIIFSELYYFQIQFLCWLKQSKQKFNTIFVIQWSVQMTWTRHKIPSVIVIQKIMRVTKRIVLLLRIKVLYEFGCFEGILQRAKFSLLLTYWVSLTRFCMDTISEAYFWK